MSGVLLLTLFALPQRYLNAEDVAPESEVLLQRLDRALAGLPTVQFRAESQSIWKGGDLKKPWLVQTDSMLLQRAGELWKLRVARVNRVGSPPNIQYHEHVIAARAMHANLQYLRTTPSDLTDLSRIIDSPNDFSGDLSVSCYLEPSPGALSKLKRFMKGADFLYGRLACDNARLPDVLAESTLTVRPLQEQVDGHSTWVLEGRGRFGQYTVWVDAESDYLPRRVVIRKSDSDLIRDVPVKELEPYIDSDDPIPDSRVIAFEIRVDNVEIGEIAGVRFMKRYDISGTTLYDSNESFTRMKKVRFSEFDPSPNLAKEDFELTLQIPEGTHIVIRDDYVWRNNDVQINLSDAE